MIWARRGHPRCILRTAQDPVGKPHRLETGATGFARSVMDPLPPSNRRFVFTQVSGGHTLGGIMIKWRRPETVSTVVLAAIWSFAAALSGGCASQEAGIRVRMPASQRPDLNAKAVARGKLIIPRDKAFNYPKFRSGQEGSSARGEAVAIGNNGARCRAEVNGEGNAWGEFLLAYCFDNMTGETLDAVIKTRLTIRRTITHDTATDDAAEATGATADLSFFIEDASMGQLLRQEKLVSGKVSLGSHLSTTHRDLVFDVKFEPDRGYYLFLSGRTSVKGEQPAHTGSVQLEVTDVSFDIQWQAAEASAGAAGSNDAQAGGAIVEPVATTPTAADE